MEESKAGDLFAEGVVKHYEPELKKVEKQLNELTSKQSSLLKELQKENVKFSSIDITELTSLYQMMKEYHCRLIAMKKEILAAAERSEKLKNRAMKLKEYKQNIALENAHYREAQMKREQDLIGKPGQPL